MAVHLVINPEALQALHLSRDRAMKASSHCHDNVTVSVALASGTVSITLEHHFQDITTRFFRIFMSFAGSIDM